MKLNIPLPLIIIVCLTSLFVNSQNAPITTAASLETYEATLTIPVTMEDFNNIGSFNLLLTYDDAIASPVAVTPGPLLSGSFAPNISNPGFVSVGWFTFPALTLPDNTLIFEIEFTKVSGGTSDLTWLDDGNSCIFYDGEVNVLNDIPTSAYYMNGAVTFLLTDGPVIAAPDLSACEGTVIIDVPISVSNFNEIGAFTLTLQYDELVFAYQSFTNDSGFPGMDVNETAPGTIVAEGLSTDPMGFSLEDDAVLFTVNLTNLGGSTGLIWFDDGASCEFMEPAPTYFLLNDDPQANFYLNGSFTELYSPEITMQPATPDTVIAGAGSAAFSVTASGENLSYQWQEYTDDWTDVNDGGVYSGCTTTELTITNPPITMNGYKYRCVVTGTCDPPAITDGNATLTVVLDTGVDEVTSGFSSDNNLLKLKASPNPFSDQITFTYVLPSNGVVNIELYSNSGEKTVAMADAFQLAGDHNQLISTKLLSPGIYSARLTFYGDQDRITNSIKIISIEK